MTQMPTAPAPHQPHASWPPPPPPPAPPVQRRPRGAAFAVGVITTSLFVGGAAGIGGAALWTAAQDDPATATTNAPTNRTVSHAPDRAADGSVESVAAKVLPSVVQILVSGAEGSGSGSGIILSEDGRILTNNHVVEVAGDGGTHAGLLRATGRRLRRTSSAPTR